MAMCCGLLFLASLHMVTADSRHGLKLEDGDAELVKGKWRPSDKCREECINRDGSFFINEESIGTFCYTDDKCTQAECEAYCTHACDLKFKNCETIFGTELCECSA